MNQLDTLQLREVVRSLMGTVTTQQLEIERRDHEIALKQAVVDKIKHEMAVLIRHHGGSSRTSRQLGIRARSATGQVEGEAR